ncbi:flagellar filament capping protein FliD [Actinoplanes oblitus]|uniref:Flagellar hook-associated protein 2 n=1 Tax=Actinoplanes oblitus TaxID=3040509 RepID=A0ABY8WG76_9ACTN|nr:flagellar filament capping protein FliD [Actinoplanes oblitus]WIM96078.1 flagellar filament capping protein FliD [Actinoplanes oblitus]
MSSSVDGLVSGMSTSSIISQLMQVEAAPQDRLKTKVKTAQTTVASYQSVNSKLSALKSAGTTLGDLATWRSIKATSSSPSVTATAMSSLTSAAGSTTFDVVQTAAAQVTTTEYAAGSTDITDGTGVLTVSLGSGDPVTVNLTEDRTPAGIAAAINSTSGVGVRAGVVTTASGDSILQISSAKTGVANAFTVNGLSGTGNVVTAASDAKIRVGSLVDPNDENSGLTPGSYEVTNSSNTFTNLLSGVNITVTKKEQNVTIDAQSDVAGIADKMQALVDAANSVLSEVSSQTAYDASTKKGSPLTGDFMVRNMTQTILGAVSGGLSYDNPDYVKPTDPNDPVESPENPLKIAFGSLSKLGIQLDSTGKLSFDATKFTAAYNEDPAAIKKAGVGLGDNFEALAKKQSDSVTSVITGRNNEIDNMNSQIENWDSRLAARKLALQKQYTGLETALGKLKNQSNWLAGQLSGLG